MCSSSSSSASTAAGGGQAVFLIGSIHPEMVEQAPLMMQRRMLPEGRTLRDELPADVFAERERRVESLGVPMAMFEGMKPWMAALTVSSLVLHQAGFQAETGLDMHFHRRAQDADMRIIGLETMEDQLNVFDELDRDAQAAFMRQTLADLENSAAQLDEATEMW